MALELSGPRQARRSPAERLFPVRNCFIGAPGRPTAILTTNIGCQTHIQSTTSLPVRHWIEALDERLSPSS